MTEGTPERVTLALDRVARGLAAANEDLALLIAEERAAPDAVWLCPAPPGQLLCGNRLPCADHDVPDVEAGIERYGCAYELREGELALAIVVKDPARPPRNCA